MALDSWQTEDYDAGQLYTRATDGQGHKDTLHVGMPPYLLHRVNAFVGSAKVLGYNSAQEFVRDAIAHRLHYWGDSLPPAQKMAWKTTAAKLRLHQMMQEMEEAESYAVDMRAGMDKAVRGEQVGRLGELIDECEAHATDMVEAGTEGVGVFWTLAEEYRGELARLKARRVSR